MVWCQPTRWPWVCGIAIAESGTGYFGSRAQQTMLNFRVRDLDAMLAQLRARGADVAEETQDMEGVGRFDRHDTHAGPLLCIGVLFAGSP